MRERTSTSCCAPTTSPGISTIRLAQSRTGKIALGLGLAAVSLLIAIMLAGAGHGWTSPLFVSIPLWVIYPLTFYAAKQDEPHARAILWMIALIALGSDALLIMGTLGETAHIAEYVRVNGVAGIVIMATWSALWTVWQVVLVRALLTRPADANA